MTFGSRQLLLLGAVYGLLGVGFGAFGAHSLRALLTPEQMAIFHTGVEYQFYHALALLALGSLATARPALCLRGAGLAFALGIPLFSGSLYLLVLTGVRWFAWLTPVGGLAFLYGWSALIWTLMRIRPQATL